MSGTVCTEETWTAPGSGRVWFYRVWRPPQPQALMVVLHGFGEHGGRYQPLAEDLAAQGVCVAVPDLWAHGRSGGRRGDLGDVALCVRECRELVEALWLPAWPAGYTVFGHSFGGLLAIHWATANPRGLRCLVAQSPLLDVAFPLPRIKVLAAKVLAGCWPSLRFSMNLDADALSRDPVVVARYRHDPWVHNAMSARTYQSIWQVRDQALASAAALQVPTLLLCGEADRIVSVPTARAWFERLTCEKRLGTFPGCYHELHHEPVRAEVLRLVAAWALRGLLSGMLLLAGGLGARGVLAGTPPSGRTSDAAGGAAAEEPVNWPVAIARLQQEMHRRPGHALTRQQLAVAYNNYGVELSGQGDMSRAINQMQEAITVDPANEQFKRNLAVIHLNQAQQAYEGKQLDGALASLQRALDLTPDIAGAHVLLGDIEYERQHLKEARAAWERAQALDATLPDLGERLTRVSQELPVEGAFDKISQAYFDLRFPDTVERSSGFDVRDALLEVRREVGSDFAYWPKYKVVVLIYTAEHFRQLRQETPEWVAGLYDGKIRIPLPGSGFNVAQVKETLYHEYTHALVHDLAKGRCPQWFNEGLAVYQETEHGASPGYEQLRDAYARKALVPWDELDGQFAWGLPYAEVQLGYQESHSVVRYFVQRYGFWRIRRLLHAVGAGEPLTTALVREFHTKLQRLAEAWHEWLPTILGPAP